MSDLVLVPMATAKIKAINGTDPLSYINRSNPSYWVISSERRITWLEEPAQNNPIIEGEWWSDNPTDQMYISFDHDAAKDLGVKINDSITINIYGRDVAGIVKNFRDVDYADFTINFVMVLNTNYAQSIPHEYICLLYTSDAADE